MPIQQVYTAFDRHLDALGVYKLDTVGDAFVVIAGLDGFKSKEVRTYRPYTTRGLSGTAGTPATHLEHVNVTDTWYYYRCCEKNKCFVGASSN